MFLLPQVHDGTYDLRRRWHTLTRRFNTFSADGKTYTSPLGNVP
jgi:hypothetical protein